MSATAPAPVTPKTKSFLPKPPPTLDERVVIRFREYVAEWKALAEQARVDALEAKALGQVDRLAEREEFRELAVKVSKVFEAAAVPCAERALQAKQAEAQAAAK